VNAQYPMDTIDTENGKVVIYSNRTWEFLNDVDFDGILNDELYERIARDTNIRLVQNWDNDVCYTSDRQNNFNLLKDTIWLCLNPNGSEDFHPPVPGILTSRYGYRKGRYHNGIDLDLNTGDTVRAAWSGKIRYSRYNDGGFGNLVIIRHHNGLETFYAHLSKLMVVPNQDVKAGEVIGLGGNTGRSFGSHLHFEVRFYDGAINPEQVIDFAKKECRDDNLLIHKALFRPGAKVMEVDGDGDENTPPPPPINYSARKYYKVRSGDTLTQIASKNNTTISKICQLNGIKPTSVLQVGKSLRVR
jgi:hypothetical protein